ncbi:hypothetical protein PCANB_002999 [Pneumocystis canis]|nr:hypothetical protein PCK1_003125 [Pneumocystis canis]KAG5438148.1 hypothetical protein PCANB_002999 [Pneumocystis canis]
MTINVFTEQINMSDKKSDEKLDDMTEWVIVDLTVDESSEHFLKNTRLSTNTSEDTFKLIGLDTPTPFLKWGRYIYRGRWEEMIGTELVFNESVELVAQSRSRLVMERVRLVNNQCVAINTDDVSVTPSIDVSIHETISEKNLD